MKFERISSLHDDPLTPFDDRELAEYDENQPYPGRLESVGENGSTGVINRIRQFGINDVDLNAMGIDNLSKISSEEYNGLLKNAIKKQYDVLFPSIFTHWTSGEMGPENQWDFIKSVAERYESWGMHMVQKGSKLKEDSANLVISLEGADFVRSIADIHSLIDVGVRSVMLQYNNPNALTDSNGLTTLGKESVHTLFQNGVIVDMAHSTLPVRLEIAQLAERAGKGNLLAFTHGSTVEDMEKDPDYSGAAHVRGITDEEVAKLLKMGGIIGLGVTRPFFQSLDHISERVKAILQLENGPESLAIGSDLGGVPPFMELGVGKPGDMVRLADVLSDNLNLPDAMIKNIIQDNAHNWLAKEA